MAQFWLALSCILGAVLATELQLRLYDLGKYPNATCNDGSPSGYYIRPSSTDSLVWIVHQQGGSWCWSEETCKARQAASPGLTSSKTWPNTISVGGLFASTDPRLTDANLVYVTYCSSDGYIGNAPASTVPFGWNFNGYNIVTALFDDLVNSQNMGMFPYTQVMYSGCSAGARGVLFNLDRVGSMLLDAIGSNLGHYGGLLDSAFWIDVDTLTNNTNYPPFRYEAQQMYTLAQMHSTLDPTCLKAFPPEASWKCLFGEYAVPFLRSDYILHQYQYDSYQLTWDIAASNVTTPEQFAYAEMLRSYIRDNTTHDVPVRKDTTLFSPACFKHCNTEGATFSTLMTNNFTLEQAVTSWFFGGAVPPRVQEDCQGFNCGTDCPKTVPVL